MKKAAILLTLVILFGISDRTFSQLKLYKEHGVEIVGSLESFLEKNDFEYAIASYPTSPWYTNRKFTCLVKQRETWYLFQIFTSPGLHPATGPLKPRPSIRQKQLTIAQADSILAIVMPEEGMKYSQQEFDALPSSCEINYREKKWILGRGADDETYHLVQRKDSRVNSVSFYGPDFYLKMCLPLNPQFKILKGMVNTFQKLDSIAASTFR